MIDFLFVRVVYPEIFYKPKDRNLMKASKVRVPSWVRGSPERQHPCYKGMRRPINLCQVISPMQNSRADIGVV
jgi:hypothetical protein